MSYTQDHDDPAPVVFLLMEDIRFSGSEPDFQFAEVSVSLRAQVGEEGGWWADGEEVMKALQLSTSRLEGAFSIILLIHVLFEANRVQVRQRFLPAVASTDNALCGFPRTGQWSASHPT